MRTEPFRPARLAGFGLLVLLGLFFDTSRAHAHGPEEHRQVLVSVETAHLDLLVSWELTAGPETIRYRALADLDRSGSVDGPLERWIAQGYLLPRMLGGLVIEVDGRRAQPEVLHAVFRDGPGRGDARSLEGMAHVRLDWPETAEWMRLQIGLELDQSPATIALQVMAPAVGVEDTNLRPARAPGLWNPMWIREQEAMNLLIRRTSNRAPIESP